MSQDAVRDVTLQDFGELPVRATVAFAVRCARRLRPLFKPPEDLAAVDQALAVLDEIINLGDAFAQAFEAPFEKAESLHQLCFNLGEATFPARQLTPYAVAHVAKAVAEGFALQIGKTNGQNATEALASAFGASRVVLTGGTGMRPGGNTLQLVLKTLRGDIDQLRAMDLGRFAELGQPVDPGPEGPLGSLWPHGSPSWM